MKIFKIVLCIVFVMSVAFFVAKGCWHPKTTLVSKTPHFEVPPAPKKTGIVRLEHPKMAIILDDWGNSLLLLKNVEEINRPVTLSVLPHLAHSREIAEEAFGRGLGVMLHMPMQPKSFRQPLEPHTILTTMPDTEIVEYLDQAIESVPHAEGMNNHQGSAATSDERVMKTVLNHLKKKGLFFVDSQVVSTTVGRRVAKEIKIPFTKRDLFIDNQVTVEAIGQQLREAEKIALARGRVVVIGHDKKVTIKTIREMVPELEKNGIQLVLVKELLD